MRKPKREPGRAARSGLLTVAAVVVLAGTPCGRSDAEPILTEGDVILEAEHLGRGPTSRAFPCSGP